MALCIQTVVYYFLTCWVYVVQIRRNMKRQNEE